MKALERQESNKLQRKGWILNRPSSSLGCPIWILNPMRVIELQVFCVEYKIRGEVSDSKALYNELVLCKSIEKGDS